jgi:hypothetical protein
VLAATHRVLQPPPSKPADLAQACYIDWPQRLRNMGPPRAGTPSGSVCAALQSSEGSQGPQAGAFSHYCSRLWNRVSAPSTSSYRRASPIAPEACGKLNQVASLFGAANSPTAWSFGRLQGSQHALLFRSCHLALKYSPMRVAILSQPRYWLVHTLAHALIRELAMASGYSAASLSERLLCLVRGRRPDRVGGPAHLHHRVGQRRHPRWPCPAERARSPGTGRVPCAGPRNAVLLGPDAHTAGPRGLPARCRLPLLRDGVGDLV